ncbi:GntR family transcriptional regulator [Variovorax sp.]|uniref:GntR family transcriptional regulator n=1 Tax=Variovorax sp. TaxID=1871043 RepID=UPI002D2EF689|nr:GntR family transcriptional regulator [Variovorax sp.]HYP83888.1 GntR family transcriptional regulator [Variovorax sp.]
MASTPRISLSERIREALEAEILSGKLDAGSRIDEQQLMERFDVSRTPAREAILQLISAGLVATVPRQGAVVATLSLPEYIAMLEILMALEGLAARLSARRMPAVQRRELEQAHEACRRAAELDDAEAYGSANRAFHEIIYDGSLNDVLARQLRAMRLRMRHPQRSLFDRPNRIRHSLAEHQTIVAAILAGDEDAAFKAMTDHISSGGNVYADAIASMPPGRAIPPAMPPAGAAQPAKGRRTKVRQSA